MNKNVSRFVSAAAVECFLRFSVCQCPVSCFQNILSQAISSFFFFFFKWVGWYKLCVFFLHIYLNAMNCFDELKRDLTVLCLLGQNYC